MSKMDVTVVPEKQEIVVTRVFDHPREFVFRIYNDPKLIPEWWGPRYLTTTVESMDVRPGGKWRFIQHDPEGNEFAFHGYYHTVNPPEQLVFTFEWEGLPNHVIMETIIFEDLVRSTKITDTSVFQNVEDRDGMVQNGMEGGVDETFQRLLELMEKIRKA